MSLPDPIRKDINHLVKTDEFFSNASIVMPDFSWRKTPDAFSSLVRIVLAQQVSTSAAKTLWTRMNDGLKGKVTAKKIMAMSEDELRSFGLSRQKAGYLHGLAQAVREGRFDPAELEQLNDEDVAAKIMELKGFGLWSAQMYMIFTLARPDIWPAQDLIIRHGVGVYLKKKERPDLAQTIKFGDKFKGRRTAVALLLWNLKDK
ncbi:MAG TPA: DNA-3-methyladenine glycosylase 2 family protein [Alphaproteobacteria bacterium]|nr:DNA-3-methyladenine glycosylase 2 family protein [Alphaproteobacteria bacterium]HNS44595.1 DNA-3-methyladenine glycosylase 2 family protein [Alphaproteobacteria bacterium]